MLKYRKKIIKSKVKSKLFYIIKSFKMFEKNDELVDWNQEKLNLVYQDYSLNKKKEIFDILWKDLTQIKDIINNKVDEVARSEVFHCLWFFTHYNADIAKRLLSFLERWDINWFIKLSYENIYHDLNKLKDKFPDWLGTNLNPWKQVIDNSIEILKSKQEDIDTDRIERLDAPSVHTSLLNTYRIQF